MKEVLWFSRHSMTEEQSNALGDVNVTQVNGNMPNVHVKFPAEIDGERVEFGPFKEECQRFDILAIVMPVNLQQQVLQFSGDRPVVFAKNRRTLIPSTDGGEDKVKFVFKEWRELVKIEVVTEPYTP